MLEKMMQPSAPVCNGSRLSPLSIVACIGCVACVCSPELFLWTFLRIQFRFRVVADVLVLGGEPAKDAVACSEEDGEGLCKCYAIVYFDSVVFTCVVPAVPHG